MTEAEKAAEELAGRLYIDDPHPHEEVKVHPEYYTYKAGILAGIEWHKKHVLMEAEKKKTELAYSANAHDPSLSTWPIRVSGILWKDLEELCK